MARSRTHCENTSKNEHFVGIIHTSDEQAVDRYPPNVPSKLTNSDLKTYKAVAVRSHLKIRSHFFWKPCLNVGDDHAAAVRLFCFCGLLLKGGEEQHKHMSSKNQR